MDCFTYGFVPLLVPTEESYNNDRRGTRYGITYPENEHFTAGERRDETYEPTLEDQNLIKSLPVDSDYHKDYNEGASGRRHGPLPPIGAENWGQGAVGSIHPDLPKSRTLDQREDYNTGYVDGYREQSRNRQYNDDIRSSEFRNVKQVSEDSNERDRFHHFKNQQLREQKPVDTVGYHDTDLHSNQHDREVNLPQENADARPGKVLVKGEVQQVAADIDQGSSNPEPQYDNVKDFFKSQRESSIVEVPNTVQSEENRERIKDNFIPVKKSSGSADKLDKEQGWCLCVLCSCDPSLSAQYARKTQSRKKSPQTFAYLVNFSKNVSAMFDSHKILLF